MKLFPNIRRLLTGQARAGMDTEKTMQDYVMGTLGKDLLFKFSEALPSDVAADKLVRRYRQWVFTCAQLNAASVASAPLRLYATRASGESRARKRGKAPRLLSPEECRKLMSRPGLANLARIKSAEDIEEIMDHPLLDMLENVNEWDDGYEALELTTIYQDLTGSAYWHVPNHDMLGVPTEFAVLPSQWVTVLPGKKGQLIGGYKYGKSMDSRVRFEPEEVIWFKYPNPEDPLKGLGCVEAAVRSIDLFRSYQEYEKALADNQARPDLLINYKKGSLQGKQRRALEQEWNNTMGGPKNAGRVRVVDQDFDVKELGFSPNEMSNLKGRDFTLLEICNAFGVPVAMLTSKDVNRANADAAYRKYMTFGITPRLRKLEQRLNAKLTPRYDDRLFLAFDEVVPEDRAVKLKTREIDLRTGKRTINEIRQEDGEEPVEWGDEPLVNNGTVPLSASIANAASASPALRTTPEKSTTDGVFRFINDVLGVHYDG